MTEATDTGEGAHELLATASRSGGKRLTQLFWRDPNNQFVVLAVIVGVLAAGGSIGFRYATKWITYHLTGHTDIVLGATALAKHHPWLCVALPGIGGLLAGIIARRFVRSGGTMGIARIMEVVAVGRRTVGFRQSLGRSFSSLCFIATGGSEGREGPIIQMGAAFASLTGRWATVSPERARVLVACGMAAGVAGAYNAPISGALFVVELVMGSFTMAVFGPAIISAFVSSVLTRAVLGDHPLYLIPAFHLTTKEEYLLCPVLGVLAGLGSVLFLRMLRLAKKGAHGLGWNDEWRMGLGGLVVGLIGLWFPYVWGNGFEGTNYLLDVVQHQPVLWLFAALFFLKMVATDCTVGAGGVGGVFTPSLMCGAMLGGSFALGIGHFLPHFASPEILPAYAALGMGGFLAGITRAPFLSIIMMAELTDRTNIVLPMMIVAMVALAVAALFERKSVYVEELGEQGIEWHDRLEATVLTNMHVRDILRRDVSLVRDSLPLNELIEIFMQTRAFYVFVGDEQRRLKGVIDLHDLKEILRDPSFTEPGMSNVIIAADIARATPYVTPDESLATASEKLWSFHDLGWLPVCQSDTDRTFIGTITRRDLVGAMDREILRNSRFFVRVEHAGLAGREVDMLELPDGLRLLQVDLPPSLYDKTVGETKLRNRFGITVVAVKRLTRQGEVRRFLPTAADPLRKGDVLIILATPEAVTRFENDRPSAPES